MKLGRIIAEDAAIAVAAVALWSPIVGLTPTDPNIVRAALALTSYVALPVAAVLANRPLLGLGSKGGPGRIDPEVRGDDKGRGDDLRAALERQVRLPYVGSYATDALRQVDAARRKHRQVVDMLSSGKLTPGSLAWQRFASGVDEAESTIRRNASLVSSACASFDGGDYAQLSESVKSGSYRLDNIDDDLQMQRLAIYEQAIERIRGVIENNERLLLELDRFAAEVSMQAMTPSDESSERMLLEMRALIDEARRYE